MTEKFDVIVVGGGTSGYRVANHLSHKGRKVLIIEPGDIGGTCLNVGCIPTKALLHAARSYDGISRFKEMGLKVSGYEVSFNKLVNRVRGIVNSGREHIEKAIEKNENIHLVKGKAKFIEAKKIKVNSKEYIGKKVVISTGAKNFIAPIKGLDKIDYISNESILHMKKLPKSVICIGGGYISCEFATFFASLGVKVTIIERNARILKVVDKDAGDILKDDFETKKKIKIETEMDIVEVRKKNGKKEVVVRESNNENAKKRTLKADEIILAIGRRPNTDGMNLQEVGVNVGKRGNVVVNSFLESSQSGVYAIGDVNGHQMFAHAAKREANVLIHNLLSRKQKKMNFNLIPWAVFTEPVISGVGMTEEQIKNTGMRYGVLKSNFKTCGRAQIMLCSEGFVKIFFDKETNKIYGATIIGPRADDLIHEITAIMNSRSPTIDTIKKTIHVHPTISEVMENLREI